MLDRGKRIAVLCGRERVLDIYDAKTLKRLGRAGAGIGPTGLATNGVELLYVMDALGKALLVYHLRPFELIRRVHLGGGPYAIAYDRERWGLWIALAGPTGSSTTPPASGPCSARLPVDPERARGRPSTATR